MSEIAILGGGPAGLIAALRASKRSHNVTVFEASSVVGGMASSFEVAGQRVDLGSHRLHPATDPETLSLPRSSSRSTSKNVDATAESASGIAGWRSTSNKDMLRNLP